MTIDITTKVPLPVAGLLVNPVSFFQRPADTTAYAQNDLIATSTTAALIQVPSFQAVRQAGLSAIFRRFRIYTNITTGFSAFQGFVEFWSGPPTFTNGDNGAYAVATSGAGSFWLGSSTTTVFTQVADAAYGTGIPTTGSEFGIALGSGDKVYWTLKEADATGATPISSQRFSLVPELYLN